MFGELSELGRSRGVVTEEVVIIEQRLEAGLFGSGGHFVAQELSLAGAVMQSERFFDQTAQDGKYGGSELK